MGRYSIEDFIQSTGKRDINQGVFELERKRLLEVNLEGMVWTKRGSMVTYTGDIMFTREGVFEHDWKPHEKKILYRRRVSLTKAEGKGKLYLADEGKNVSVLKLENDSIFINGNDLLAFENSINWGIRMVKKIAGMMAGGLFNVKLEGQAWLPSLLLTMTP